LINLRFNILRPEALNLYRALSSAEELEGLTLIGGTALALQIGHRFSLDFDFATFEEQLPTRKIDALVARLKAEGHTINLITDAAMISQHKINTGSDLLKQVRDYVMDGVKVTFFAHGRTQKQRAHYSQAEKVTTEGQHFSILGLDALKTAKTLVLADRVRSRDLFDLMVLMQTYGYSVELAMDCVKDLGQSLSTATMRAWIPLMSSSRRMKCMPFLMSVLPNMNRDSLKIISRAKLFSITIAGTGLELCISWWFGF